MKEQQYQPGQVVGFFAGCPVCAARQRSALPKGTHFRIVSGYHFGRTGVVVKDAARHQVRPYEFLAQMDDEPATTSGEFSYEIELVEPLPPSPKPDWAPGLSLRDFAAFHEEILKLCTSSVSNGRWKTNFQSLALLAVWIWQKRIPIPPEELWAVLAAHGVPKIARGCGADVRLRARLPRPRMWKETDQEEEKERANKDPNSTRGNRADAVPLRELGPTLEVINVRFSESKN